MARVGVAVQGQGEQVLRLLVTNLRSDLHLISNEAKKKYPAVREVSRRGSYVAHVPVVAGWRPGRGGLWWRRAAQAMCLAHVLG